MKSIIYLGMDVHTTNYTLCCYTLEDDRMCHLQQIAPDYRLILKYMDQVRRLYNNDVEFLCGYEAGCLGYSLYHQLTAHQVRCVILAPTTMGAVLGVRKVKTDKRDAMLIAKCLAFHTYHPVHIPTPEEEQVKEFIRMRDDHKLALKRIKQQISAFCLRHGFHYTATKSKWTQAHWKWLKSLKPDGLHQETLNEYLLTCSSLSDKLERLDRRIEELAAQEPFQERVRQLTCLVGVKTHTALSIIVEVGDFNRFPTAGKFASFLGLTPGEASSSDRQNRFGITKAGNTHVRRLLVEAAQSYARGQTGRKSKDLKARQAGNKEQVIAYADKGSERLRRRFRQLLYKGKQHNVIKTAIARELSCFIWGMMTDRIA